jgi:hypothetical protein
MSCLLTNIKHKNRLVLIVILLCFLLPLQVATQNSQAMGETGPFLHIGIAVLMLPDQSLGAVDLSPQGNFIFANADLYNTAGRQYVWEYEFISDSQYIWNIEDFTSTEGLTYLEPTRQLMSANSQYGVAGKFSPNGRYLAIKTSTELQLWDVPNFELQSTQPAFSSGEVYAYASHLGRLSWSTDGSLLATRINNHILVWDIFQNTTTIMELEDNFDRIIWLDPGWLIYAHETPANSFIVCSSRLDACDNYQSPSHSLLNTITVSPDGEIILHTYGDLLNDGVVGVWQRQETEEYTLTSEQSLDEQPFNQVEDFCPGEFSPDGHYLFTGCNARVVWDVTTWLPVFELPEPSVRAWLPDSLHFIAFELYESENPTINIYGLGSEVPIDVLYLNDFFEFGTLSDLMLSDIVGIEKIDISEDGRIILINLGWVVLITSIGYE